jgi:MOSC domain-containing protein YiiM
MAAQMGRRNLTGWYLRVLEEGTVKAGSAFELLERSASAPTILDAWRQAENNKTS